LTRSTINRGHLSSFGHTLTHKLTRDKVVHKFGGVQLQRLQLGFGLGFWFVDFLLGALSLERERYAISWLSVGSGTACKIILYVKVTMLGGGYMPMVG
jgi:hypothetical protein